MNGIEILNKVPIYEATWFSVGLFIFLVIVFVSGMLLSCSDSFLLENIGIWTMVISFPLIIIFTIIVGLGKNPILTEESGRYEYECTINDDVSFKELYDKYEIVEQNGKIWTIRDKRKE